MVWKATVIEINSRDYYDRIAAKYDAEIGLPHNRAVRECFWKCTESALQSPSRILDFGAGSGIDAQHFAAAGHFVAAYDSSEGMLEVLRQRCADQIARGAVAAVGGRIEQAAGILANLSPFDAIVSNFAVFSTISQLKPVFELFGTLVRPGGLVLIVIQNPWYPPHFRTGAFWKAILAAPFTGAMRYRSAEMTHVLHHRPDQIVRAGAPAFIPTSRAVSPCRNACFGVRSAFRLVELSRR